MPKTEFEIEQLRDLLFDKAIRLIAADLSSNEPGRYIRVTEETKHLPDDKQETELDTDLATQEAAQCYLACTDQANKMAFIMDENEEELDAFLAEEYDDDDLSEYAKSQLAASKDQGQPARAQAGQLILPAE